MKKIGIVASGSSETEARIVLDEGMEKTCEVEDLVLVDNRTGNRILAVCRKGLGVNENLRTGSYSLGLAYARRGRTPSDAKEFFGFDLSVIGEVGERLNQNKTITPPRVQNNRGRLWGATLSRCR